MTPAEAIAIETAHNLERAKHIIKSTYLEVNL